MSANFHLMTDKVRSALATAVRVGSCALSLIAATHRPAAATVLVAMDFAEQCVAADRVFVGTVRAVESRRIAAAPQYFETLVTFAVEETVVGAVQPEVVLRFAGGEVGGVNQSIDGMPDLRAGERYVVLIDADHEPPLVSPIVGFNQGLYRAVTEDGPGGRRSVVRDRAGRPLAAGAFGPRAPAGRDSGAAPAEPELADFLAAVRAVRGR
jgi:hypothetical protein